jgi:hypothetical protein
VVDRAYKTMRQLSPAADLGDVLGLHIDQGLRGAFEIAVAAADGGEDFGQRD